MAASHSLSGMTTISMCSINREIPLHVILPRMHKSVLHSGGIVYRQGLVLSERSPGDFPNNLSPRDLGSNCLNGVKQANMFSQSILRGPQIECGLV
jgi:hypothetical protein